MADNRPWAKIDTGYIMNPKWFQVERIIADGMTFANGKTDGTCHQLAISNAVRCARDAHLASILYSAQNQTDGIFPVRAIKALVSAQTDEEEAAITALFEVELWINHPGGMAEVRDYLEHQTPASLTKKRSEAGKKGASRRWDADGKCHESANGKTMASANAEEKRREEKRSNNPPTPQRGDRDPYPTLDKLEKDGPRYIYPPEFETFYATYPHARDFGNKTGSYKAWRAKVKAGTAPDEILAGAQRHATDPNRVDQYTKACVRWLSNNGWLDAPLPARNDADRGLAAAQRDMARYVEEPRLQVAGDPYPWETDRKEIGS